MTDSFICNFKVVNEKNKKTPALVCHGDADEVVKLEFGKRLAETLEKIGIPVTFKVYHDMEHTAINDELADVFNFISDQFK